MKTLILVVTILICLSMSLPLMAWTQYKDGGIHNISTTINDDIWVDYLAPGMQTKVNLLSGGIISSPYGLQAYEESQINLNGGSISGNLTAYNNSQVTINSGSIGYLNTYDSAQITMDGGSVNGVRASIGSQVTIFGGSINGELYVEAGSPLGSSQITIYGSSFNVDGNPIDFGEITSVLGGNCSEDPIRQLTGTLTNGGAINTPFRIGDISSINLVFAPVEPTPEPSSMLILGSFLPGMIFLKRRRRK